MTVRELIDRLLTVPDLGLPVEIATCERKDEWYEVYNVEADTDHRGNPVVVINTD